MNLFPNFVYTSVYKSSDKISGLEKLAKIATLYANLYTLVYTNFNYTNLTILTKIQRLCYSCIYFSIQFMPNDAKQQKEFIRVSVSEAAKLFGVNSQTIRRAIAAQEVTYIIVGGRYKINFESLVKWSQRHTTIKNKLANRGIGQFIGNWKIKNPLFSPNPKTLPVKKNAAATPADSPAEPAPTQAPDQTPS